MWPKRISFRGVERPLPIFFANFFRRDNSIDKIFAGFEVDLGEDYSLHEIEMSIDASFHTLFYKRIIIIELNENSCVYLFQYL